MAQELGVDRITIRNWCKADEDFDNCIKEQRCRSFDAVYRSAVQLACGIPEIDSRGRIVGWVEKPDSKMAIYLMSKLGKEEGFGEEMNVNLSATIENRSTEEILNNIKRLEVLTELAKKDSEDE